MPDLSNDPIINAIHNGIKHDINVAIEQQCWRAALILMYSAMDTMAYLNMPNGQDNVTRTDFVRWADRFIRFPCRDQLSGNELYGARCGIVHTYGIESSQSRTGNARQIGYMDISVPEVRFDPNVSNELVLVSIVALRDALFKGIDDYLIYAFSNTSRGAIAEQRIQKFIQTIPTF